LVQPKPHFLKEEPATIIIMAQHGAHFPLLVSNLADADGLPIVPLAAVNLLFHIMDLPDYSFQNVQPKAAEHGLLQL
jgi:hypothetical protein